MKTYISKNNSLVEVENSALQESRKDIVWIDMLSPTQEEIHEAERFLSIRIPTKEEMQEIESSSRLYQENNALIMTVNAVSKEDKNYKSVNVTFILKGSSLITIRYDDIAPFSLFLRSASTTPTFPLDDSLSLLLGILEAMVEKIADSLESISATIEQLSQKIFDEKKEKTQVFNKTFIAMGLEGANNSKTRESLSTISRMVVYLKFKILEDAKKRLGDRIETLALDATDLKDHSTFLEHKISFILDASLGLVTIEQNNIIKIFSIAAVVLLPPTLIASIYGMNFKFIPELHWQLGYPFALFLMVLSAILPFLYFKKKGWL